MSFILCFIWFLTFDQNNPANRRSVPKLKSPNASSIFKQFFFQYVGRWSIHRSSEKCSRAVGGRIEKIQKKITFYLNLYQDCSEVNFTSEFMLLLTWILKIIFFEGALESNSSTNLWKMFQKLLFSFTKISAVILRNLSFCTMNHILVKYDWMLLAQSIENYWLLCVLMKMLVKLTPVVREAKNRTISVSYSTISGYHRAKKVNPAALKRLKLILVHWVTLSIEADQWVTLNR